MSETAQRLDPLDPRPLDGRTCLVTGASRGIGRAIACELARCGGEVVVNYRSSDEEARSVVNRIEEAGETAMPAQGDVSDPVDVEEMAADIHDELGPVDVLVNNAGITQDTRFVNMTRDEWDEVMDVNLGGMFNCTQTFYDDIWNADEGRLINISSIVGKQGNFGQANYAAAKAGVLGLVRNCAQELKRYNVRVNSLWPEAYTRMYKSIPEEYQPDGMSEETHGPQLVAPLPAFMASDEAEGITGCTVGLGSGELSFITDPDRARKITKEVPASTKTGGWTPQQIADAWDELTSGYETERIAKPNIPNVDE